MATEQELLRAVREDPDDDTVRLALADWYAENGQEERGEFVRVQCRLAGMDDAECWTENFDFGTPCFDPDCPWLVQEKLRQRELKLWRASRLNGAPHPWFGAVPGFRYDVDWLSNYDHPTVSALYLGHKVTLTLFRGFTSILTAPIAVLPVCAALLFPLHPIETLTVTDVPGLRVEVRKGEWREWALRAEYVRREEIRYVPGTELQREAGYKWATQWSAVSREDFGNAIKWGLRCCLDQLQEASGSRWAGPRTEWVSLTSTGVG